MAYWYFQFKGFHSGNTYEVRIEGLSGNTNKELIGGAQPFVIDEDDNDDVYTWVRTQTGVLTICDTGETVDGSAFDWRDLLPVQSTDRPVTIRVGSTVLWSGYLQSSTYSGGVGSETQIRSFAVQCILSQLGGYDFTYYSSQDLNNFGGILYGIFSSSQYQNLKFYFHCVGVEDWLRKRVNYLHFTDDDGNRKFTNLSLLEEICKFFGFTCRISGYNVYFVRPTDNVQNSYDFEILYLNDLYDISQGTSATVETAQWDDVAYSAAWYANTNNQELYYAGWRKTKIVADVNPHQVLVELPMEAIENVTTGLAISETTYGTDGHKYERTGYPTHYVVNGMDITLGDSYAHQTDYFEGNPTDKHNYNWTTSIHFSSNLSRVRMVSLSSMTFDHGVLVMNGSVYNDDVTGGTHQKVTTLSSARAEVWVGQYYWDGSSWVLETHHDPSVDYSFPVPCNAQGKFRDNRVLNSPYPPYTGYGMPISSKIEGTLEIYLWTTINLGGTEMNAFDMQFLRQDGYNAKKDVDQNTYIKQNLSRFPGEREVSIAFGTDNNNTFGYGIILNEDGSFCYDISYRSNSTIVDEKPEEHLCDVMSDYGSQMRCQLWLALKRPSISTWTPLTRMTKGGKYYWPQSFSIDFRDEVVVVRLVEVNEFH